MHHRNPSQLISIVLLLSTAILLAACQRKAGQSNMGEETQRARGSEIVAEFQKRDSTPSRHVTLRMVVATANQPEKEYELEIWRKQSAGETKSLLHVLKPASEKELVSLSIQRTGENPQNVTYHPGNNEYEEFDTDRQAFGGLTVQEMLGDWSKYEHRLLGEKEHEGVKAYEIENTLKPNESSTIKRFVVLIRADNMLPAAAHVFNAQGTEIRTYRIKEYRNIEGHPTFWRVEIENPVRHIKINLEVLNESFNERFDDKLFTRENLKQLATA
jgi:outer membrane lipoprotein-sorting protein